MKMNSYPIPSVCNTMIWCREFGGFNFEHEEWLLTIENPSRRLGKDSVLNICYFNSILYYLCFAPATYEKFMSPILHSRSWKICLA